MLPPGSSRFSHSVLTSCQQRGNDVVDDVLGIPTHTSHQRRAQRVEKGQPHEIKTGTRLDDAPIMNGHAIVGLQPKSIQS